ncbi:MAG TPA: HEPN domain-containing protein [Anaerolineales bacterium]|nr:HEPN domain-containing protein [Anaerolineales bacterium]
MPEDKFDAKRVRDYWLIEAEEALQVADHLVEKKDYSYALFFGHLAVEKMLKALHTVRIQAHPPKSHNLLHLVERCNLEYNDDQKRALAQITSFNMEARYPDERRSFRNLATPEFTKTQMQQIKEVFQWLRSLVIS